MDYQKLIEFVRISVLGRADVPEDIRRGAATLLRQVGEAERDTSPKLGIVAAVTKEIEGRFQTVDQYWRHGLNGISAETSCALAEHTHDAGADSVVMHYCTQRENEVLRRLYRRGWAE